MNYSLNIAKLVNDYLGPLLKKPKRVAWLNALLYPVILKHDQFIAFKQQMDAEVTITIQVNRFRRALRDRYNDETIEIIHPGNYLEHNFIFLAGENGPAEYDFLASENHEPVEYDFLENEYRDQVDYIVRIPESLLPEYDDIFDFVTRYNLTSRRFAIEAI